MKFIEAEDLPQETYYKRRISDCGNFHIMLHPVLYGYRVRLGEVEDKYWVYVDTCAGSVPQEVSNLYNLYLLALERFTEENDPDSRGLAQFLHRFRASDIKPYFNDAKFKEALYEAAGVKDEDELHDKAIVDFKMSDLIGIRIRTMQDTNFYL